MINDDIFLAMASGSGHPMCPRGCPDVVQNLVDQCSDSRPRDRPSASEVAATLEKILSNLTFWCQPMTVAWYYYHWWYSSLVLVNFIILKFYDLFRLFGFGHVTCWSHMFRVDCVRPNLCSPNPGSPPLSRLVCRTTVECVVAIFVGSVRKWFFCESRWMKRHSDYASSCIHNL